MPIWAWITITAGLLLLFAAAAAGGVYGFRYYERRLVLQLAVRIEALEAASAALADAVGRLAVADDEELEHFAGDHDTVERRVLHDVSLRARHLADELDHMRMTPRFVPLTEVIADAAFVLAEEAGRVTDEDEGALALEHLGDIDLSRVMAYVSKAHEGITAACEECGLEETAVYGGGLYL